MEQSLIQARQEWALTHPCRNLWDVDAMLPAIRVDDQFGGKKLATIIFLNLFDLPPHWVAQIGIIGDDGNAMPGALWTANDKVALAYLAKSFLESVGVSGSDQVKMDGPSIVVTKQLSGKESITSLNAGGLLAPLSPIAVGEINAYDFSKPTQVSDFGFQPVTSEKVYVDRGN